MNYVMSKRWAKFPHRLTWEWAKNRYHYCLPLSPVIVEEYATDFWYCTTAKALHCRQYFLDHSPVKNKLSQTYMLFKWISFSLLDNLMPQWWFLIYSSKNAVLEKIIFPSAICSSLCLDQLWTFFSQRHVKLRIYFRMIFLSSFTKKTPFFLISWLST